MANQSLISHEHHHNWYKSRNVDLDKRFIYGIGHVDVGSMHAELGDQSFEVGIMCGDTSFLGHWVNLAAVLYIYDLGFLGFDKKLARAAVRPENAPSLRLMKALGFMRVSISAEGLLEHELKRESYLASRAKYSKFLFWRSGETEEK